MSKKKDYSCWKEWNKTLSWEEFLKYVKPYKHIRVGVIGGDAPFGTTYFRVTKKEIIEVVRMHKMSVTFTVMVSPFIKDDIGVMSIDKMRMTLLDK